MAVSGGFLAYYGFPLDQMKILDGGMDGWKAKGYPTEMTSPKIERTTFQFLKEAKERKPLLCTLPEVKSALKGSEKVVLDVRSKKEFIGEELKEGAIKPGRIPEESYGLNGQKLLSQKALIRVIGNRQRRLRESLRQKGSPLEKISLCTDTPGSVRLTVW